MKVYAVYRLLYGEDFLRDSILSITPHVRNIFICQADQPWGGAESCVYRGCKIWFPSCFDRSAEFARHLENTDRSIFVHHINGRTPLNQYTRFINTIILTIMKPPDIIICMDADHVWRWDQIEGALEEFQQKGLKCAMARQVEVWKGFRHRVPERPARIGPTFWNIKEVGQLPKTTHLGAIDKMPKLDAFVHNMGFAVSERAMFWKHMVALGTWEFLKDSEPNEDWFEEKWLKWKPGMKDLEVARGYEDHIPEVVPYDPAELPESIRERVTACD